MRIRTLALAGGATAVAAYLLDPREGAIRRRRISSAIGSLAHRRTTSFDDATDGWVTPRVTVIPPPESTSAPDPLSVTPPPITSEAGTDARTADRVKRTLQARRDLGTDDLVVDVVNGVAYLSGDLRDGHTFGEIVDLTREVPGVRRVQSLFHVPDSETIGRTTTSRRIADDRSRRDGS